MSSLYSIPQATDIVLIDTQHLDVNIGADCWGRCKPQQVQLSLHLHLTPGFLHRSGESDDVRDSLHYGHLSKAISGLIAKRSGEKGALKAGEGEGVFNGLRGLVEAVADEAFRFGGLPVQQVRAVACAPKLVLLANNFSMDAVVARWIPGEDQSLKTSSKVTISELTIPVIIGVNPPEREAKQKVVIDIDFYEAQPFPTHIEYQAIVSKLVQEIEKTEYLTLEKFVMQIVKSACLASPVGVEAITVRAQKPSALSTARYSGVEITRRRADFVIS
ncbi:tetrahydrobiopterin biosynthesis enzymes-like protein [Coprinopsis marcescibilis]|uniref:dihydroneopterin aldolase n=1 Tax=Coprinopsis marcescibilis TaxID=230819 RepID=A0A5C3KE93_COPMA|nr:tetrahydrobiopterin biosynthesis enzymes-like protein [Coprinopsis marcescibilis]